MTISRLSSLALVGVLAAGPTAFAPASTRFHAHLVRAEPSVNDTVAVPPRSVRLWFSEPVELGVSRVRVIRVGGDTVKTSELRHEGSAATTAALDLASATVPGMYTVMYHVVARDGHPTSGSYSFMVRSASK